MPLFRFPGVVRKRCVSKAISSPGGNKVNTRRVYILLQYKKKERSQPWPALGILFREEVQRSRTSLSRPRILVVADHFCKYETWPCIYIVADSRGEGGEYQLTQHNWLRTHARRQPTSIRVSLRGTKHMILSLQNEPVMHASRVRSFLSLKTRSK